MLLLIPICVQLVLLGVVTANELLFEENGVSLVLLTPGARLTLQPDVYRWSLLNVAFPSSNSFLDLQDNISVRPSPAEHWSLISTHLDCTTLAAKFVRVAEAASVAATKTPFGLDIKHPIAANSNTINYVGVTSLTPFVGTPFALKVYTSVAEVASEPVIINAGQLLKDITGLKRYINPADFYRDFGAIEFSKMFLMSFTVNCADCVIDRLEFDVHTDRLFLIDFAFGSAAPRPPVNPNAGEGCPPVICDACCSSCDCDDCDEPCNAACCLTCNEECLDGICAPCPPGTCVPEACPCETCENYCEDCGVTCPDGDCIEECVLRLRVRTPCTV